MEKVCWSCYHFTAYYTKGYCCFVKEKCGHCSKHHKTVDKHFSCENWKVRLYDNKIKKGAVIRGLDEALNNINMIKQILTETDE